MTKVLSRYWRVAATTSRMVASSLRHGITAAQAAGQFIGQGYLFRRENQVKIMGSEFGLRSGLILFNVSQMNDLGLANPELLHARGEEQTAFHERAAKAAESYFGNKVFVRAVVEISNYCRENCVYCGMRRSNKALKRFRTQADELAELLIHHRPASVTDVNIQAGEDPIAV